MCAADARFEEFSEMEHESEGLDEAMTTPDPRAEEADDNGNHTKIVHAHLPTVVIGTRSSHMHSFVCARLRSCGGGN
jgi:hypothetical protein